MSPFRTTFPSIYVGQLPPELTYADAFHIFKPLGILAKDDSETERPKPYGFLCVADYKTTNRLQQEIASKDYHFGKKSLKSGDIRAFGIPNKNVAEFIRQQMPSPMQDWPQAIADFKERIENHYGYAVYVRHIPRDMTTKELRDIFEPFGDIKNVSHACRRGMRNPWAFVNFHSAAAAEHAVKDLDGIVLGQETLSVVRAEPGRDVVAEKKESETKAEAEPESPQEPEPQMLIEGLDDITDGVGSASISPSPSTELDRSTSPSIDDTPALSTSAPPSPLIKDLEDPLATHPSPTHMGTNTPPNNQESLPPNPLAQVPEQDSLADDIVALGPSLLEIMRGVWADKGIYEAESMDDVVQLMARSPVVRAAVQKLLANEMLVYRAL